MLKNLALLDAEVSACKIKNYRPQDRYRATLERAEWEGGSTPVPGPHERHRATLERATREGGSTPASGVMTWHSHHCNKLYSGSDLSHALC